MHIGCVFGVHVDYTWNLLVHGRLVDDWGDSVGHYRTYELVCKHCGKKKIKRLTT